MQSFRPRRGHRPSATAPSFDGRPRPSVAAAHQPSRELAAPRTLGPVPTGADIDSSPFTELGLHPRLVRAVLDEGYTVPTPIQAQAVPHILGRRDILGCAPTGTGKTAAFVLPILQLLSAEPTVGAVRALIVAPTRELAAQIAERIGAYGAHFGLTHAVVYGGVSMARHHNALRQPPDLLVATPGRLLDLMRSRVVRLDRVTHFVLDEADRMLDMGFIHDVKRIIEALPRQRQTLLFSATIPASIKDLAESMLKDPARVAVTPQVTTAELVDQHVVFVSRTDKRALLERMLHKENIGRAIVFTRTKHGASRLSDQLEKAGIGSAAIHGNKSQGARERALESFRAGSTRVLVATDIAARGIDVDGITHVFNFELPNVPESYVHRIGRTGRAGAVGRAVSFCDPEERKLLVDIERFIRRRLPVIGSDMPERTEAPREAAPAAQAQGGGAPREGSRGRFGGHGSSGGGGGGNGGGRRSFSRSR